MVLPALLVLLAVGGVAWLLTQQDSTARRELQREQRSAEALATARDALLGFAAIYRNPDHPNADYGYLPCPDLDGDGSSETCGSKGHTSAGRLPYLTLNLPDLRDGSGECLWYVVAGSIKNNPKPDALNWDAIGQIRLIDTAGATVRLAGDPLGQAIAVVIAAGPPLPDQQRHAGPARCGGDDEARQLVQYVEGLTLGADGVTTLRSGAGNDRIVAITTGDIYRALKRRAGYPGWLQKVLQATADCLSRPAMPAVVAPERLGAIDLGRLPPLTELSGPCRNDALRDAVGNWLEVMRYARCVDGSDCLAAVGQRCRGALLFGGERNADQRRTTPDDRNDTRNYLEPATLAALRVGQLATLPVSIGLSPTGPTATDVALCLP